VSETKLVRDNVWPTVLLLALLYAEIMLLGQDINLPQTNRVSVPIENSGTQQLFSVKYFFGEAHNIAYNFPLLEDG